MITKDQATHLTTNTVLHHKAATNMDGTPLRAKVNGKCKTWKTRPDEWRLPVKYGLRHCFYINEGTADDWTLPE